MKVTALFAAIVVLSGCSAIERSLSGGNVDDDGVAAYPMTDEAELAALGGSLNGPREKRKARYAPAPKAKPREIALIAPDILVGKSPGEVREMIGQPISVDERAPARVWSYRSQECAADIFFYLDVGSSTFRALTVDLKDSAGKPTTEPRCLGTIQALKDGS